MKHKVRISVSKTPVLQSGQQTIRHKLLDWLFGSQVGMLVITPGQSVESVEIHEIEKGSVTHESDQITP